MKSSIQKVAVIVPSNPFVRPELRGITQCLAALDVQKLMEWWPGTPHTPHRDREKVRAIQRSLDWKRVVQIAAYLLQKEIIDAPRQIEKYFQHIYQPKRLERGREWPPKIPKIVGFVRSEFPTFSSILINVNGASIRRLEDDSEAANLVFDEADRKLNFSVIDGQHRINGAYLAVCIMQEEDPRLKCEIPVEIFIDLDKRGEPPRRQAQIFIDVNFYQKKVDRSLVADLFPTARGPRGPLDNKERAQDLGRMLMLETGPLVGMIQIPGIKYGVRDVVTLATLNSAIEDVIDILASAGITSLDGQVEFLATCLDSWLTATGRKEDISESHQLDPENVAYQGRVLVSFLTLIPWCIWRLRKKKMHSFSVETMRFLSKELQKVMKRSDLLKKERFLAKGQFKARGYLGSGGLARFRDTLWAATLGTGSVTRLRAEELTRRAGKNRSKVFADLSRNR